MSTREPSLTRSFQSQHSKHGSISGLIPPASPAVDPNSIDIQENGVIRIAKMIILAKQSKKRCLAMLVLMYTIPDYLGAVPEPTQEAFLSSNEMKAKDILSMHLNLQSAHSSPQLSSPATPSGPISSRSRQRVRSGAKRALAACAKIGWRPRRRSANRPPAPTTSPTSTTLARRRRSSLPQRRLRRRALGTRWPRVCRRRCPGIAPLRSPPLCFSTSAHSSMASRGSSRSHCASLINYSLTCPQ